MYSDDLSTSAYPQRPAITDPVEQFQVTKLICSRGEEIYLYLLYFHSTNMYIDIQIELWSTDVGFLSVEMSGKESGRR